MDESARLRRALVDAISAAHRMQQRASNESHQAVRWRERARYAEARRLGDLSFEALSRAKRHMDAARLLEERVSELRVEIERLRSEVELSAGGGRPPPLATASADPLAARFVELEVARELERLHAARSGDRPLVPPPRIDPD
jgi:hypothetical protein